MKNKEKIPDIPHPHIPEVSPDEIPGPHMPVNPPEIIPEQKPQPAQPPPEVPAPGKTGSR